MGLKLVYKNSVGTVVMTGNAESDIRITGIEGIGWIDREYYTAIYSGCDGQETYDSRVLPRTITVGIEFCCTDVREKLKKFLAVLGREGYLYLCGRTEGRRIKCNQVRFTDATDVLNGRISTLALQFVCDCPYFENESDTVVSVYERKKLLESPFSLPSMFGEIVLGADICIVSDLDIEPIIKICCMSEKVQGGYVTVTNESTGKRIHIDYSPEKNEMLTVDVKRRRVLSSFNGNIIRYLSEDTFLGDFVLEKGVNRLRVDIGNVGAEVTIACEYNNLFCEAVTL